MAPKGGEGGGGASTPRKVWKGVEGAGEGPVRHAGVGPCGRCGPVAAQRIAKALLLPISLPRSPAHTRTPHLALATRAARPCACGSSSATSARLPPSPLSSFKPHTHTHPQNDQTMRLWELFRYERSRSAGIGVHLSTYHVNCAALLGDDSCYRFEYDGGTACLAITLVPPDRADGVVPAEGVATEYIKV
eukprot:7783-Chlamydomonas_euryale.AAC.3